MKTETLITLRELTEKEAREWHLNARYIFKKKNASLTSLKFANECQVKAVMYDRIAKELEDKINER